MQTYTLISLTKPVDIQGLSVGDIGIVIEDKTNGLCDVMFFNKNALGDYLVASLKSDEFCKIPYSLSQDQIAEFEDRIDDIKRKPTFQNSVFKEYDRVMIVVEKDKYSAYGVHKGAVGTIMADYSINDKWYVIFSDEHGEDYADIEVSEKDMVIVNNQN